ncbi:MAG: hypothetical protein A3H97_24290 [Acidobacteria bacterium RIFCSPLOWO2_02_FULL_65_29]|nr:MAG: hypothetical protein A3H97_24290 [Acidobacteria bacterium RIFCSPLOWO2_02_FULL_65_29]
MCPVVTLPSLVVTAALIVAGGLACQSVDAQVSRQPELRPPPTPSFVQPVVIVEPVRLTRVEQWLTAVLHHEPGTTDASAQQAASWSGQDLRTLWIDLSVLVRLMRTPGMSAFNVQSEPYPKPTTIRYSPSHLNRMRALACVAAGTAQSPACSALGALRDLDPDLLELAVRTSDARLDDADNFILRRGALLHADVAMLLPNASADPLGLSGAAAADNFRVTIADGRQTQLRREGFHWDVGRGLLAYVRPRDSERPAPGRDEMVRQWYVATAAWMQDRGDYDTAHLARARELFPADLDILFLSGCLHETFASPPVQSVVQGAVLPTGITLAVGPEGRELRQAESYFRRSLQLNPAHPEARVRLGHVLARLNRHADAARELREAVASTDDDLLRYYASMFLGATAEALQLYDEAQAAFERAAAHYPTAQSPRLALSELARRRGDRGGALREMQRVFALPVSQFERYDPWWNYDKAQARNIGDLLARLRRPFLEGAGR